MMSEENLKIVSYNIHKGFSRFRRLKVHDLKQKILIWNPDILFLQEVQGLHTIHARKKMWPDAAQHEFLAGNDFPFKAYGPNRFYNHGHHGNAILSKYPILDMNNYDISTSKYEKRGALYCKIEHPIMPVNVLCVHLSLLAKDRKWQYIEIAKIIENYIKKDEPLIMAGDFNDWKNEANKYLVEKLGLDEIMSQYNNGKLLRSFPSEFPLLALDRVYSKNIIPHSASIIKDCSRISDHSPIKADFIIERNTK